MLFNSLEYFFFFIVVFFGYWFLLKKSVSGQNLLILIVSYIFYGWWDARFLVLIAFSTVVDYTIGIFLDKFQGDEVKAKRKILLLLSLLVNLGILLYFKYYNFFLDNIKEVVSVFGIEISLTSLNIILPVGISFYTFQTLSYSIDVYKGKMKAEKNFISFAAFVSFFPQLVAGPIERATHLVPQFGKARKFILLDSVYGLRQILWGLFKKVVIADNCAEYANMIFNNHESYSGSMLLFGALMFTFQIYGDFSGYSDIAIGSARILGFDLMKNFNFPYFSRDIGEFWRRWHISLSTWFRDYLYIPLGGSKGGVQMKVRNTFIIFLVSGFWHGANWTFIIWGFLNAVYFLPLLLANKNRKNTNQVAEGRLFIPFREGLSVLGTFLLTVLAWIFFRADNVSIAIDMIAGIFSLSLFELPNLPILSYPIILLVLFFIVVEWLGRDSNFAIEQFISGKKKRVFRWSFYYLLIVLIIAFEGREQEFIYFQF